MPGEWQPNWEMPVGSRDRWAGDYERGRPGWPPRSVEVVNGLSSAATVVDLGAGTGKLARVLAAVFDRVVAVEPSDPMRALLVQFCPGVEAVGGSAESIPLADATVDAVFA